MGLLNTIFGDGPGEALVSGRPNFAVLDTETSGLSAESHRIVEIAIVRVDGLGQVIDEWTTLINPQGPVGATRIHGISKRDVADAPTFADVAAEVARLLDGAVVVAHNARFDLAFLGNEFARMGVRMPSLATMCTLEASRHYLPHLTRRRLADCCLEAKVDLRDAHSALGDASATAQLLQWYLSPTSAPRPRRSDVDLPRQAAMVAWPSGILGQPQSKPVVSRSEARTSALGPAGGILKAMLANQPLTVKDFPDIDAGGVPYLELLAQSLEDGVVTDGESENLSGLAVSLGISAEQVHRLHESFIAAMARYAFVDGFLSDIEHSEISSVATLIGISHDDVERMLNTEASRYAQDSLGAFGLPAGWAYGAPLLRGNRVVFTGSFAERDDLERRTSQAGLAVGSSVSRKTAALVTDGSFSGNKLADAVAAGVRVLTPAQYRFMLDYVQDSGN